MSLPNVIYEKKWLEVELLSVHCSWGRVQKGPWIPPGTSPYTKPWFNQKYASKISDAPTVTTTWPHQDICRMANLGQLGGGIICWGENLKKQQRKFLQNSLPLLCIPSNFLLVFFIHARGRIEVPYPLLQWVSSLPWKFSQYVATIRIDQIFKEGENIPWVFWFNNCVMFYQNPFIEKDKISSFETWERPWRKRSQNPVVSRQNGYVHRILR